MRIMYCNFNMFTLNSSVIDDQNNLLCSGDLKTVAEFMAMTYGQNDYGKIILEGPYAEVLKESVLNYGKTKYNLNEMNIEVK